MAVLGSLTLLEKRLPEDPQIRRLLQNAIQGADRGKALTQRLLAFSRRQELKPQAVDLGQLVRGMEELLRRAVGHGIVFSSEFSDDLPPVLADANQLELALLNVALNARDAMAEGGSVKITAEASTVESPAASWRRAGNGGRQVFSGAGDGPCTGRLCANHHRRHGCRMDEATWPRQPSRSLRRRGLARGQASACRWCMAWRRNRRTVRIRSEPKAGTVVELWLPRANCAPAAVTRAPESPTQSKPVTMPCTVLIVDDDSLVMRAPPRWFRTWPHAGRGALRCRGAQLAGFRSQSRRGADGPCYADMTGLQLAGCIQEKFPGLPDHLGDRLRRAAGRSF